MVRVALSSAIAAGILAGVASQPAAAQRSDGELVQVPAPAVMKADSSVGQRESFSLNHKKTSETGARLVASKREKKKKGPIDGTSGTMMLGESPSRGGAGASGTLKGNQTQQGLPAVQKIREAEGRFK